MKEYFTIKNENGRYLKTGGIGWTDKLDGAIIGTNGQMSAVIKFKECVKDISPYQHIITYVGTGESAWDVKRKIRIENGTKKINRHL